MTRNEIIQIAAMHADPLTVARIRLVLGQFKTVNEFFDATTGELMHAYNAARPNGKRGLGKKFFKAMDAIRSATALDRLHEKAEACRAEDACTTDDPSGVYTTPATYTTPGVAISKPTRYTLAELKAITAFMELASLNAIDLDAMTRFCASISCNPFRSDK